MAQSADRRNHRRVWPLMMGLILLLLGAYGAWRLAQPPNMRLVNQVSLPQSTANIAAGDFICQPDDILVYHYTRTATAQQLSAIAVIGWDGRQRWEITFPSSITVPQGYAYQNAHRYPIALSPNKQYCVAIDNQKSYQEVSIWREGIHTGTVRIPPAKSAARPWVDDQGQVLCWYPSLTPSLLLAIAGNRIVARGTVRLPADVEDAAFSPNGTTLIAASGMELACFNLTRQQTTLIAKRIFRETEITPSDAIPLVPHQTAKHMLVTYQGSRFDGRGRVSQPDNWQLLAIAHQPQGGSAVLQGRTVCGDSYPDWLMSGIRVLDAETGETWSAWPMQYHLYSPASPYVTPDGRYALIDIHPKILHEQGDDAFAWLPVIGDAISEDIYCRHSVQLSIYERPGRLRAQLKARFDISERGFLVTDGKSTQQWHIIGGSLSSDGHTFNVLVAPKFEETGDIQIWQYHW